MNNTLTPRQLQSIEERLDTIFCNKKVSHPLLESLRQFRRDKLIAQAAQTGKLPPADPIPDAPSPLVTEPLSESVEELLERKSGLLALPEAITNLRKVLNNPESSASDVAHALSLDPKLTASVLRIVNSPLFNRSKPIDTVTRAVSMLGMRQISSLALGAALFRKMGKYADSSTDLDQFWRHSMATALISARIAREVFSRDTEPFFIAGLLHDIGRLFILGNFPRIMQQAIYDSVHNGTELYIEEKRLLRTDHTTLGAALLRHWRFSENIINAIERHHDTHPFDDCQEACAVHIADTAAKGMGYYPNGDFHVVSLNDSAWKSLQLSEETLTTILREVETEMHQLSLELFV